MIAKPRMEYDEVDVVFTTTIALHTYLGKRFQSSCELKRNLVRNVDWTPLNFGENAKDYFFPDRLLNDFAKFFKPKSVLIPVHWPSKWIAHFQSNLLVKTIPRSKGILHISRQFPEWIICCLFCCVCCHRTQSAMNSGIFYLSVCLTASLAKKERERERERAIGLKLFSVIRAQQRNNNNTHDLGLQTLSVFFGRRTENREKHLFSVFVEGWPAIRRHRQPLAVWPDWASFEISW